MAKTKTFLIVFSAAFLLSHIFLSVLGISPFTLDDPSLLSLIMTIVAWLLSWGVGYIVYETVHDALVKNRKHKEVTD